MSTIAPFMAEPDDSGSIWPGSLEGSTNSRKFGEWILHEDLDTVGANAIMRLAFRMPPSLPSGTGKLRLDCFANASTGDVIVDPQWISIAPTETLDPASLNAEGNTTITWASGDAEDLKSVEITLDADTLTADELVYMELVFKESGSDLATQMAFLTPYIVFE